MPLGASNSNAIILGNDKCQAIGGRSQILLVKSGFTASHGSWVSLLEDLWQDYIMECLSYLHVEERWADVSLPKQLHVSAMKNSSF